MERKRVDWREAWLASVADGWIQPGHCPECGGGLTDHEAINVNGQPFARCLNIEGRSQAQAAERVWSRGAE